MEDNRLYTLQRRNEILRILREQGSVSVNRLAEHFQVSGTTIRLDLTALEKTGVISRTHGGAMLSGNVEREPLILEREKRIADSVLRSRPTHYSVHTDALRDDAVTNLQRRLWELGFLNKDDVKDSIGTFNDATRQAVVDAQLKMGYGSADGVAGVEFQSFLFSKYGDKLKQRKKR